MLSSPANRYPPHLLRTMRAHAAGRAWRGFQYSPFSLAGYWGSGLKALHSGRRDQPRSGPVRGRGCNRRKDTAPWPNCGNYADLGALLTVLASNRVGV